jgi:hypothetical protein
VITRASGIVEIFRLYLVARGSTFSDSRMADQLAGPRNRAAHAGITPSEDELRRAIATSSAVLHEACPLPDDFVLLKRAKLLERKESPGVGTSELA